MKSITFVFDGLQFGGIERVGVEYIKLLSERGYIINVINLVPKLNDLEKEIPKSCPVIYLSYPRWITPQKYSKIKKNRFWGKLVFIPFFLFFSFVTFVYSLIYRYKLPFVDIVIAFSGHWNDLTFVVKSYSKKTKKIAWLHGDQYSYYECSPGFYSLHKSIKNLVCLSDYNDDKVLSFNTRNNINKKKIYNPLNFFKRSTNNDFVDELKKEYGDYILMVGRLAKDKDQATLIKAIKVLKEKYHLNKHLLLVGDGSERENLGKLVKELSLGSNVVFVGSRYDVQNFYKGAYIYVHSSPAEGLPTVLLEAMFYSLPIVSTDSIPGVSEILKQNEYGIITRVGDEKDLADAIARVYNNKELRDKLVLKGKERVRDFFPQTVIAQFEDYIGDLK